MGWSGRGRGEDEKVRTRSEGGVVRERVGLGGVGGRKKGRVKVFWGKFLQKQGKGTNEDLGSRTSQGTLEYFDVTPSTMF